MKLKFRAYLPGLDIYLTKVSIETENGEIGCHLHDNMLKLPYYIDWDEGEIRKDLKVGESELVLRFNDCGLEWVYFDSKDVQLQIFLNNVWQDFEVDNG